LTIDFDRNEGGMKYKADKGKGVALAQHVADTPMAQRMVVGMGEEGLALMRTFQQHFGAKLVHYQDEAGEVGKRPGWAE
jgi:hypothetical protein